MLITFIYSYINGGLNYSNCLSCNHKHDLENTPVSDINNSASYAFKFAEANVCVHDWWASFLKCFIYLRRGCDYYWLRLSGVCRFSNFLIAALYVLLWGVSVRAFNCLIIQLSELIIAGGKTFVAFEHALTRCSQPKWPGMVQSLVIVGGIHTIQSILGASIIHFSSHTLIANRVECRLIVPINQVYHGCKLLSWIKLLRLFN